ncbi:hypothetical protein B0H17DRAFT_1090688 [Mycena rosella]|uniref:Uncharacterized protein n=1 Tax=Mycena rosella TaxID=1033263 RepID=A0AAD7CZ53_MYCRO|nr:hypothetical protein B0H17DRAFT_1090688 [Mycena rosella]
MFLLRSQAREMAALGASALARASRYLPPIHYSPMQWNTLRDYAQFALEEAPVAGVLLPERLRDLENLAHELRLVSYSLDICASPHDALLVERLEDYLDNAQAAELFDTEGLLAEISPGGALLG